MKYYFSSEQKQLKIDREINNDLKKTIKSKQGT